MSRLKDIDVTKPLKFYARNTTAGNIGQSVAHELSSANCRVLIKSLRSCCWHSEFEKELTRMSVAGESVLTGKLPFNIFCAFVAAALRTDFLASNVALELAKMIPSFGALGAHEVYFAVPAAKQHSR